MFGSAASVLTATGQLLYTGLTSRTLPASSFGAYAGALAGVGLVNLVTSIGPSAALQRAPSLTSSELRSFGGAAWGRGFASLLLVSLLAWPWSRLWGIPEMWAFTLALGAGSLLGPLAAFTTGQLRRASRHKSVNSVQVLASILGFVVGGAALLVTHNQLALAIPATVVPAVTMGSAALLGASLPIPARSRRHLSVPAGHRAFGRKVTVLNGVLYVQSTILSWAAGRSLGSSQFGQWSRGNLLPSLPAQYIITAIQGSLFAEVRHVREPRRFRPMLTDALIITSLPAFVSMLALAAASPVVTPLVLGPGWSGAMVTMPLIALSVAVNILYALGGSAFESRGDFGIVSRSYAVVWIVLGLGVALSLMTRALWAPSLTMIAIAVAGHLVQLFLGARRGLVEVRRLGSAYARHLIASLLVALMIVASEWLTRSLGLFVQAAGVVAAGGIGLLAVLSLRRRLPAFAIAEGRGVLPSRLSASPSPASGHSRS